MSSFVPCYITFLQIYFVSIQEILDGLEFARGDPTSTWGSIRAKMGHPEPFDLRYVAIGNEDCGKTQYRGMLALLYLADDILFFDSQETYFSALRIYVLHNYLVYILIYCVLIKLHISSPLP